MPISPQNGEITKIWCLFSIGSDVRSAEHLETNKRNTHAIRFIEEKTAMLTMAYNMIF